MVKRNTDKDQGVQNNIFVNNPFLEGLMDWMDSPRGQLSNEVREEVWCILEQMDIDAKNRKIIWDDGQQLSISESVERIAQEYRQFPADLIESHLVSFLEMEFAPEHYSQEQLDELDVLTEQWILNYHKRIRAE